jgi:tetratricopeptide (TPR) repeat protein
VVTGIDRTQRTYFLRTQFLVRAAACFLLVLAGIPTVAVTSWLVCSLPGIIMVLLALAIFGAVVVLFIALTSMEKNKREAEKYIATAVPVGIAALILVGLFRWLFDSLGIRTALDQANPGWQLMQILLGQIYFPNHLSLWSMVVLGTVMFLPTASLLIIGRLRLGTILQYYFHRITYRCDACRERHLPLFICPSCSEPVAGLEPSIHGIWQASCAKCRHALPATDQGGRMRLAKRCSKCGADEISEPRAEFLVPIVGAASSGKTTWLTAAIWKLEQTLSTASLTIDIAGAARRAAMRAQIGRLERCEPLAASSGHAGPAPLGLVIKDRQGSSCLSFVDCDGADFAIEEGLDRYTFFHALDGMVFILDPFAEAEVCPRDQAHRKTAAAMHAASADAAEIQARLINSFERHSHLATDRRFPFPVAVVVTKIDGPGVAGELHASPETSRGPASLTSFAWEGARASRQIRSYLLQKGLANVVRIFEARFQQVSYFASCVAAPSSGAGGAETDGVLAPLAWIAHRVGAIGTHRTRAIANAWHTLLEEKQIRSSSDLIRAATAAVGGFLRRMARGVAEGLRWLQSVCLGAQGRRAQVFALTTIYGLICVVISALVYQSHREEWAQNCYRKGVDEFTRHENAQAVSDLTSALALGAPPAGRFEQSDLIQIHLYRGVAYRRLNESRKALEDFGWVIESAPEGELGWANRALEFSKERRYAEAVQDYRRALQSNPRSSLCCNNLAWILATCKDAASRNGAEAVQLATEACGLTQGRDWMCLGTLAAAYAEAGRFDDAVKVQKEALERFSIPLAEKERGLQRLHLYEQRIPCREDVILSFDS